MPVTIDGDFFLGFF